jgi:outer membrane protein assembly factor BamB
VPRLSPLDNREPQALPDPGEAAVAGGPKTLSRRHFIVGAAGGVAALGLAGLAGYEWPHGGGGVRTAKPSEGQGEDYAALSAVQVFRSRPDLLPPAVKVRHLGRGGSASSPRFFFLATRIVGEKGPGQQGLMVIDRQGRLIWFQPTPGTNPFDFNVQAYRGTSVLTWWQGRVTAAGYGIGTGEMAGSSYRLLQQVQGGDGLRADLHELNLTSAGTALITAYEDTTADLSGVGGLSRGRVLAGHAQEIDLATGKLLWDWDSLGHVRLEESYEKAPSGKGASYDYFHINSVSETPDGNILISAKNTWAIYKVDRSTGKVIWRMNGKRSDFRMGPGTNFYWQHDARMHGPGTLTVFDDGAFPPEEKQSRGLLLSVDAKAMRVALTQAYSHPAGFLAANQGSTQLLADGRVLVGWGTQPYFSEFAPDGTLLLDGQLPIGYRSYRAFAGEWVGHPVEPPRIAVRPNPGGGTVLYASWNGATEIDSWTVLAGKREHTLDPVGSQERTGFETAIAVNSSGPYFAGVALDSSNKVLGRSGIVRLPS